MTQAFDPYHRWLGIPPAEQPPNHYRLLGLVVFEADADVISSAADRQMQHLRTFQAGGHSADSQRLLNAVAAARVCLLNPEKKAEYDRRLKHDLAAAPADPPAAGLKGGAAKVSTSAADSKAAPPPLPAGRGPALRRVGPLAGVVVVTAALVALFVLNGNRSDQVAEPPPAERAAAQTVAPAALVIDWPESERAGGGLTIDGRNHAFLARGAIRLESSAGEHAVRLSRPGFEPFETTVRLTAGQSSTVGPAWKAVAAMPTAAEGQSPPNAVAPPSSPDAVPPQAPPAMAAAAASMRTPPPVPLAPAAGAELPNAAAQAPPADWRFSWSPVQGATQYHLFVKWPPARIPIIERDNLTSPSYEQPQRGRIAETNRRGWTWKVRALVGGEWTEWSPEVTFDFAAPAAAVASAPATPGEPPSAAATMPDAKPAAEAAAARVPVPAEDVQQPIAAELESTLKTRTLKKPEEKLELAAELIDQARAPATKPAERFVFLRKSMELALEGGDAAAMFAAIDAIAADFDVDPLAVKAKMLGKFADTASTQAKLESLAGTSAEVLDALVAADRCDAAFALSASIMRAMQRPSAKELVKDARDRRTELQRQMKYFEPYQEAKATLASSPGDPAANLAAARWRLFGQGDMAKALSHLRQGSDEGLRAAAEKEAAAPADAETQLALADAWWTLGAARKGIEHDLLWRHAGRWYEESLAGNPSAVNRLRIEKRLDEIRKLDASPAASLAARGAHGPGRVKLAPLDGFAGVKQYYRPSRIELAARPPVKLKAEPKYRSASPLYGAMAIGTGPLSPVVVALDEPEGGPPKVYVDLNNDRDLTNDGDGAWSRVSETNLNLSRVSIAVPYDRKTIPALYNLYRFRDKPARNGGAASSRKYQMFYYNDSGRKGEILSGGQTYSVVVFDESNDGRYDELKDTTLVIDLNRDGRLEGTSESAEWHKAAEPFNIHGRVWEVARIGPEGLLMELRPSRTPVAMHVYLDVGLPAPAFVARGLKSETIDVKREAAAAKFVLLDFWASWCGPCREDLPNVKRLAAQYRKHGLVVLGVNIDDSRIDAQNAVGSFGLDYPQVFEGQGWKSEVARQYRVRGIPQTYLLDKELKIVAKGLRGDRLAAKLNELLGPGDKMQEKPPSEKQ